MYEYPFGNGQQLNLDWFLAEWKNLLAAWEDEKNGIEGALQAEIDRAEAALADVFAARDAAAQSAANALESKNAAAQSASDASGYLATVSADANAARDAARNAAQSESNAADSAETALASKNAAGQSERNAAQSEANANSSKNAAAQSAADALANKDAAAQSAADALANKDAAAQSASNAEDAAASVEASAQQIATNASDIIILKNSLGYLGSNGEPIVDTGSYTKQAIDASLNIEKHGNFLKINGVRGSSGVYFTLNDGIKRSSIATYGEITDFIDTLETGYLFILAKGTITPTGTITGIGISFICQEFTESASAITSGQISVSSISQTYFPNNIIDCKDGIIYTLRIPEHTNPIRILIQARMNEFNCEFYFKYVSDKEIAILQALTLENIGG